MYYAKFLKFIILKKITKNMVNFREMSDFLVAEIVDNGNESA